MGAAAISDQTLVLVTLIGGLIRPIPAVSLFVAHIVHADTLPAATLVLGRAFTYNFYITADLITVVPAVIFFITLATSGNTVAIITLELI